MYTVSKDEAGNVEIHKALKDDNTPWIVTTGPMLKSEDQAKQRDLQQKIADNRNITAVRVADIGAKKGVDVANINQGAITERDTANRHQKLDMWLKQKGMDGAKYFTYLDQQLKAKTMTPDAVNRAKEDYNTMMRTP